jgi:hypothetical protein
MAVGLRQCVCNATQNVPAHEHGEVETAKRGIALFLDVKVCHREQSQHRESF